MNNNSKLQSAVRLALGVGAGALTVAASPGALAQDDGAGQIEEIVVTGSRIKRADLDSASPVTVLDREAMEATGITDVGYLIQRMPSMSGSPIGTTTNNGGDGSVQVDLRGMGVDRTLTLVNGMRTVDRGDYQTIPQNMIERVEILKDGASAVYGADAVAGVVNIITRRDFEGLELTAQTADFFDSGGAQTTIGALTGTTFDGGNFVFGAEYVTQKEVYQGDTPWDIFQDQYYIYPEGCENQVTAPYDGTPSGGCYPLGSSRIPESRINFLSQGGFLIDDADKAGAAYQAGLMSGDDGRLYNYSPVNLIQTPYNRVNIFTEGNFDLTDTIQFNAQVRANTRESYQELAPMPYDSRSGFDPGYQGVFNGTAYNGVSQDNYYLRQAVDSYNTANGGSLIYEPVVDMRRRMVETTRAYEQNLVQYQAVAGLTGQFGDYDWDIYYNRGYRSEATTKFGQFNGIALGNAMGPSADFVDADGIPECYQDIADPNSIIADCVPFNYFGGSGTVTPDMLNYVATDLIESRITTSDQAGFNLTGAVFDLPGGQMGWAVGYQYLATTYNYTPDSGIASNIVTGSNSEGTQGSLYNNGIYGEVLLPVFDNGVQALDLKGGVRYDDYNLFDGEATWQLGIEFRAIESLKLRATAGTVFRAPTIRDLYDGLADDAPQYNDPCDISASGGPLPPGCAQTVIQDDTQLPARIGGNPTLTPETGETYTAGVVWEPEFGNGGLTVTLDYWNVQIENGISSLGVQYALDQCYNLQNADACALITRRPDYSIGEVLDLNQNVAEQGASGIDTEIRYTLETGMGQWEAAVLWAHLNERTKIAFAGNPEDDLSGRYTDPTAEDGGAYATDKANFSLQWFRNDLSIGYLGSYISGLTADTLCNCGTGNRPDGTYKQDVPSQMYHDLVANYTFERSGTTIAAGVTNFTDEAPPFIDIGFNATTDPSTYRMFGRGYYFRLTQLFQ